MRAAAVLSAVRRHVPIDLCVIGPAERRVWPAGLAAATSAWIPDACDAGVVQADDVTVDLPATARRLESWLGALPVTVEREAARLAGRFDLVVGDVPSPAFEAAASVEIPSVAIANFTWDWIYSELGFHEASAVSAKSYAKAGLLIEAAPFAPMAAFARRVSVGLVAREPSRRRTETRAALGLQESDSVVLVAFQPASVPGLVLPAVRRSRRFVVPAGWPADRSREDVVRLDGATSFEDAIAAADVIVGKPGYGLIGDVEAAGARFLYVPRPGFPENQVLERHLSVRAGTASLAASRLADGTWEDELAALEQDARPARADAGGAERAAREIVRVLGIDTGEGPE